MEGCTRPDVAFVQNLVSRYQQNPGNLHWVAVKHILKYLRNTKDMFLVYGGNPDTELEVTELEDCLSLADLGASINLMPLSVWKKLLLPELTHTRMTLELANRSVAYSFGVAEDVFVKVGKFHFLADFIIDDYDVDPRIPLIPRRPFLRTTWALIDVHGEELTLRVNDEAITFKVGHTSRYSHNYYDESVNQIDIPIDPQDQEKTTLTCPYGMFSYRRMPFGLCNAPRTFKRCMIAIFHDMIEETIEEKRHFMVKEGIVLGHKISKYGIVVDRDKVNVIAKRPHPTFVKAFNTLKKNLTEALILVSLDWDLPFKIMCDASDFAVGAVLRQWKTKHFQPIHYARKTITDAQAYYTTMEKELLAIMYAFEKFRPYLFLSKTIVYTDHLAFKYLLSKQDAKPRLLWWVLPLQEFNFIIRDKKGAKNLAVDHLSRLENPHQDDLEIRKLTKHFLLRHLE
nr:reverse transcriptase domain-containing protein [Tanacetum cinerariifolium]